jgi:hypothetical protein
LRRAFRRVIVDIAKLRSYCLSETHLRGRHKARVFRSRLGLNASAAGFLRQKLLEAALAGADDMIAVDVDRFGQRYILDFEITTAQGTAAIRSAWIVRTNDDVLRFVTCFVL